jgi:putative colanic acid biosynthesis acetyltransferase WcaF
MSTEPQLLPQTSLRSRAGRALWMLVSALLFRTSPRPFHAWRAFLLRCFGARLGRECHIYPRARIWAPWNLHCDDMAAIADDVVVYNAAPVFLGRLAVVSQEAYLCGATHDINDPAFPMIKAPIHVGARAWVCARATVMGGVSVADGAVLALGAVATRDLAAWTVYGGIPAVPIGRRQQHE